MYPVCTLLCPFHSQSHFFFLLCQNGEKHHKGHRHGFPLVWLYEKVRGGHHEMAVRPSRRSRRDRSRYTSPEMARLKTFRGCAAGTRKVPPSLAWPHLVPNWSKCLFKSVQSIAKVWSESRHFREKLLLISLLYPPITHKSRGLLRSCSFWWIYGSAVKCSQVHRKHLEHQTWFNASQREPCEFKWLWKNTTLSSVLLCYWVFTFKPGLFNIPTSLGCLSRKKRDKKKMIYKICFINYDTDHVRPCCMHHSQWDKFPYIHSYTNEFFFLFSSLQYFILF